MRQLFKKKTKQKKQEFRNRDILIEAIEISKKFRLQIEDIEVLKKVNLIIREGDFFAILGPEGSGKSTLVNCLTGLEDIDGGTVYIDEEDLNNFSEKEKNKLRKEFMGFVYGYNDLVPFLNIDENIRIEMKKVDKNRLEKILKNFNLEISFLKKLPEDLQRTARVKVSIIKALAQKPKIIWCEDFGKGLGLEQTNEILDSLIEITKAEGIAVIITTDAVSIAMRAKKVIRIEHGKVS